MIPRLLLPLSLLVTLLLTSCETEKVYVQTNWKPITPEERAITKSGIEPDAGAEILLKEMRVDNSSQFGSSIKNYVKLKILDERGLKRLNTIDISSINYRNVSNVAARVTQPDGTTIDLDPENVFSRETFHYGTLKVKTKSFTFPGMMVGSIIEYEWNEHSVGNLYSALFPIAEDFPIRTFKFTYKAYAYSPGLAFTTNLIPNSISQQSDYIWTTELHDVPSRPDDEYLPSRFGIQPWIAARCTWEDDDFEQDAFWKNSSKRISDIWDFYVKWKTREIKTKARELTDNVDDPGLRIKRIYDFCTHGIVNIDNPNSNFSHVERKHTDPSRSVSITLKRGRGDSEEINLLFAALAKAAGFDVRLALCNDRTRMRWEPTNLNFYAIPDLVICINNGTRWKFYQPGTPFVKIGMLCPDNAGTVALLGNKNGAQFLLTDLPESSASQKIRKGTFTLSEDGTLEGEVTETITGDLAYTIKNDYAGLTPEEREDKFKAEITSAEISELTIGNIEDPDLDVKIKYKVTIPDYASTTGERIFLEPCYFEKDSKPVFTKETRKWDIQFPYTWEAHDTVSITYPRGFELEEGSAPGNQLESDVFSYLVKMDNDRKSHTITYSRDQKINARDIPAKYYSDIKTMFDEIGREDKHVVTLRHVDMGAEAGISELTQN